MGHAPGSCPAAGSQPPRVGTGEVLVGLRVLEDAAMDVVRQQLRGHESQLQAFAQNELGRTGTWSAPS